MRDATLPALRLGTVLDGRYVVGSPVAFGSTSVVHRGEELGTGRPVAIKFVWGDAAEGSLERAQWMSGIAHPHLASILSSAREEGGAFQVLPWLDGGTLALEIERTGRRPESLNEVIARLRPIVEATATLHDHGLVHLDLKPGNIMLTAQGPVLVDFGSLGRVGPIDAGAPTAPPRELTPAYAAPEQAFGARCGPPADVYALGLMFVELLSGRAPKSLPLEKVWPEISASAGSLLHVIQRCLVTSPSERWPDARSLARALEVPRARASTSAVLIRELPGIVTPQDRSPRIPRRFFVIATALLTLGAAASIAGVYVVLRDRSATASPKTRTSAPPPSSPQSSPPRGLRTLTPEAIKLRLARADDDASRTTTFSAPDAYESVTIMTRSGRIVTLFTGVRIEPAWLFQGSPAHAVEGDRVLTAWSADPKDAHRLLALVLDEDAPSLIPTLPAPSLSNGRAPTYDVAEFERRLRAARFHVVGKNLTTHLPKRIAVGQLSIGRDASNFIVERAGCATLQVEWHRNITEPSAIPKLMKRPGRVASARNDDSYLLISQSREADIGPWCGEELLDLLTR